MKSWRIVLICAVLGLAIVIYLNKCKDNDSTSSSASATSPAKKPALEVSGIVVRSSVVTDRIFATGTVLANEEVEIKNEIAGRITSILFKEGSKVKKGDLLLKIFDEDLKAQLKKLNLQKELAEKNESRQRDLLSIQGISQQDYDIILNQLNQVKSDISLLQVQISKAEIRAPFSGTIGLKAISEGAMIPVGTRIVTMQDIDPVKIEFSIPERYRFSAKNGEHVNFKIATSSKTYSATVYASEPKIDVQTRTLLIRATCSNPNAEILPGSFANLEVPLNKIDDAMMIPTQSLIPDLKGQKVITVHSGKASPVKVTIGFRNDSAVQVISGLQAGDTVITSGILQARPDMSLKVNITNW